MKNTVTVKYTMSKELSVYAPNETEAEEKAVDIVLKWNGVEDAEATECCEDE